jgi:hypothetical protein
MQRFGKTKKALLMSLAVGMTMAALVALVGSTAHQAEAAFPDKIVFASNRVAGKGVDNPTGDREIFLMSPNGTGVRQLTSNAEHDGEPVLSPDGTKIAYMSRGIRPPTPRATGRSTS